MSIPKTEELGKIKGTTKKKGQIFSLTQIEFSYQPGYTTNLPVERAQLTCS